MRIFIVIAILLILISGCIRRERSLIANEDRPYELVLPAGFPMPEIPEDNQLTHYRVELGKLLFHDTRLSRDETISCASCHLQSEAFADHEPLAVGIDNRVGMRNTPTLTNVAYNDRFFADGGVPSLELQVLAPIPNENEHDFTTLEIIERLKDDDQVQMMSSLAYGREFDGYVITRAIASYERTLISGNSRFDQFYFQGMDDALTQQELDGWNLFQENQCASCHSGFNFTDNSYHNIGQYEAYEDAGRERISMDEADNGKFKTPTLRNIELTAPYMHNGSMETLEDVVDFFNTGGVGHVNQDELITPLDLTSSEKESLIAFLKTLTDYEFVTNPEFQP